VVSLIYRIYERMKLIAPYIYGNVSLSVFFIGLNWCTEF